MVSSTNDVLGVWRDFYFRLFSSQELSEVDQRPFLDSIECRLTSNESKLCEGDLMIEECSKALSNMPSAKSPVLDTVGPRFGRHLQLLLSPQSALQIPETRGHHSSVQEGGLPGSGELAAHHTPVCGLQNRR